MVVFSNRSCCDPALCEEDHLGAKISTINWLWSPSVVDDLKIVSCLFGDQFFDFYPLVGRTKKVAPQIGRGFLVLVNRTLLVSRGFPVG